MDNGNNNGNQNGNQNNNGNNNNNNNNNNNGNGNANGNGNGNAAASSSNASSNRPTAAPNASSTNSAGNRTVSASKNVTIPDTAPAGSIVMVQPAERSTSFYKIAEPETITFKWNYTDLIVQPTSITVVATCTANGYTYKVGPTKSPYNTFAGNTTQILWNPYDWQSMPDNPPFIQASYTLMIWDERGQTAPAGKQGYLAPYTRGKTQFALYSPQPYVPWQNWTCATCSGKISVDHPATLPLLMSVIIMIISAWGLLRRT